MTNVWLRCVCKSLAATASLCVATTAHNVLAQTALDAAVQAQIDAAQATAAAATARAQAQIAEAQARVKAADEEIKILQNSGSGVNSIRVVGNQAGKVVVECQGQPGAEVSVNSVVDNGQSLKGKTVIVTGRNVRDVELRGNCKQATGKSAGGGNANAVNVNSVVIR